MIKRLIKAITVMLSVVIVSPGLHAQTIWDGSADTEWEGEGTESSPYLISTAAELAGVAKRTNGGETFEGKYFRLTADISLSDPATPDENKPLWEPIGMSVINNGDSEDNPGGFWGEDHWFKGTFDGNGHTIRNLWYAHDSEFMDNFDDPFNDGTYDFEGWSKSLFGNIDGATITDLTLSDVSIQCMLNGAALVCVAKNSTITDITVDGMIVCGTTEREGGSAAGIVTEAEGTTIERCKSAASVRSVSGAGGVASQLTACIVKECVSTGRVASMRGAGGLAGWILAGSEVSDCHSSAEVIQLNSKRPGTNIGGFVGSVSGSVVKCCSSTGNLKVDANGYGFAGSVIDNGLVESCYAVCDIVKDGYAVFMTSFVGNIGAGHLVGEDPVYGYVRNCYGAAKYSYQPCPSDVITTGNHIGGFASSMDVGSQAVNCFYNSDTATGINSVQPSDADPQPLWFEFGLTTEYMQSQAFVDQLNEMAGVIGSSLWKYNPGAYPTPTGIAAPASNAPFGGGDGSESAPWRISTKDHLLNLARLTNHGWTFENQFVEQTADIALNAPKEQWGEQMPELWTPIGQYCKYGGAFQFQGSYNGNLHTVSNMYLESNVANFAGLFGVIGDGARISNLGVTDAYICNKASISSITSGILVGSVGMFNDESEGERHITNCWTSGYNESYASSGLIGGTTQWGKTFIDNCYTTAQILSSGYRIGGAFVADEFAGDHNIYLSASYFNGSFIKNGYNDVPSLFNMCVVSNSYYSTDSYAAAGDYEYFACGRTSDYMKTPEFVNELSYSSAAAGLESPWRYSVGEPASFIGKAPEISVTFVLDDTKSVTFKALSGSRLTAPVDTPPEEGMTFVGWYDDNTSQLFDFANATVSAPVTLRAKWTKGIAPDYTPFKNKFAKTYHITTPAQLLAFSNIVNGNVDYNVDGVEQKDFEGYTIVLDNDIEWNPVADYDNWGNGVTPLAFRSVGWGSNYQFNGTFDGQGHSIIGLYVNESLWGGTFGMFTSLNDKAVVKNLILKNACVEAGYSDGDPVIGLLVAVSSGRVYRCGAEGKIIMTAAARDGGYVGGLIGRTTDNAETTALQECYAIVDARLKSQGFGGLIYSSKGNIDNSFARSDVKWANYGSFGGVVCVQQGAAVVNNSWCATKIDWKWSMDKTKRPGGAAYDTDAHNNKAVYYDKSALGEAFGPESEWLALPAWENAPNPYKVGIGLSDSDMKRMDSKPEFDYKGIWGRRNDKNDGYPYLRWTAPGLENDAEDPISVQSVTLDKTEIKGKPGDTVQLTATVSPDNASEKNVVWTSSDDKIATVSETGLVTLVADGTVVITVASAENEEIKASCDVTVETPVVAVTGITLTPDTYSGNVGDRTKITATVQPADATDVAVVWTSSDENIVTVDQDGNIALVGGGDAVITAASRQNPEVKATCSVTVKVPVTGVTLNHQTYIGKIGTTLQLVATVAPENATDRSLRWNSSRPRVATVDDTGLVTLKAEGEATVTVYCGDFTATCEITVEPSEILVENIEILPEELDLYVGGKSVEPLRALVFPDNATNTFLDWESDDPDIATVDADGFVTGLKSGETKIIARATDGSEVSAYCIVRVAPSPSSGIDDIEISGDAEVIILSLQGKVIFDGRFADANLQPGVYLVRHSDGTVSKILIK